MSASSRRVQVGCTTLICETWIRNGVRPPPELRKVREEERRDLVHCRALRRVASETRTVTHRVRVGLQLSAAGRFVKWKFGRTSSVYCVLHCVSSLSTLQDEMGLFWLKSHMIWCRDASETDGTITSSCPVVIVVLAVPIDVRFCLLPYMSVLVAAWHDMAESTSFFLNGSGIGLCICVVWKLVCGACTCKLNACASMRVEVMAATVSWQPVT